MSQPSTFARIGSTAGILLLAFGCGESGPPFSPEHALETFELHPDFSIELFLSEPLIADPIAVEFDELGRVWVLESSGYPLDVDGRRGRLKLIDDSDGDGRPDRVSLFEDKLVMPTGVMRWRQGAIVVDAPQVLYLEDTDGDGRDDLRRVLLDGFAFTNPQHTVSSPVYGPDNWIYLSHEGITTAKVFDEVFGDQGGEIHYPERPESPRLPLERRSVRFRPDTFELEYTAAPSQYGQTFDEWGDLFGHNNSNHARHEVLAVRYLERNPRLRLPRPFQPMYEEGNPAPVFPITKSPRFEMLTGVGMMTSASGLTRYLGGAYPGFENAAFVAEPAHNLVHADFWEKNGSSFVARSVTPGKEFLASTDSWFRPANFTIGPDGALYIVDYYREVIEHPEWTSAEIYESGILYHGDDRGRIYRITPKGGLPFAGGSDLATASPAELVEALSDPNIWRRRTAQRLLVDFNEEANVDALSELARNGASAAGRFHALWTLDGAGVLDEGTVRAALKDPEPGIRKNAIRLAERFPSLQSDLLAMEGDPDSHVRLILLASLGFSSSPEARAARRRMLFDHAEDEWMGAAALSAPNVDPAALLGEIARRGKPPEEALAVRLAEMIDPADVYRLMQTVSTNAPVWVQRATLQGLARGLAGTSALDRRAQQRLLKLAESEDDTLRDAALGVLEAVREAVSNSPATKASAATGIKLAADRELSTERRADALRLVALVETRPYDSALRELIDWNQPEPVQIAAVRAFALIDSPSTAELMLEKQHALTGPVRQAVIEAMFAAEPRLLALVGALAAGEIQPWMLVSSQKNRLIMHPDAELRARARKLLTTSEKDNEALVKRYRAALSEDADAARGEAVFERICEKCHTLRGQGSEVGPDLATISSRPTQIILNDILLPNQSIAQTYESYIVETKDGRMLDGVLGSQSPTHVVLRREGGEEDAVERSDIREMRAAQLSAMPTDLYKEIPPTEMADLIYYIKTAR